MSTVIAHALGFVGYKLFRTRAWVIVASGRPNTSALPLLLLQSLATTGVLDQFANDGESTDKLLARAQSLILLNVVVQQTITFQIAPALLKRDRKTQEDGEDEDVENSPETLEPGTPGKHGANINPIVQDRERVGLLEDQDGRDYGTRGPADYTKAVLPISDEPDIHWPQAIGFLEKPVKKVAGGMSPPLIGAIVALIVGVRSNILQSKLVLIPYIANASTVQPLLQ